MTKYILVGGYIYKAADGGKAFCEEMVKGLDSNKPVRILDSMFARTEDSWLAKFEEDKIFFSKFIPNAELVLAQVENFLEQLKDSDVVFFQGGVPFELISKLDLTGDWKSQLDRKVIVGTSGSADTFVKYYGVGKTGRIGEGLGIILIKFIPHWKSDYAPNIDWDSLLENLKSYKEDLPIHTLKEGEFVVFNQ